MPVAAHRPATFADASRLFALRRKSITGLAPRGMSGADAQRWAANLTLSGMEQKLRAMDIWVAEIDGRAVGWGAIRGDRLEGLYTDPEFAGQGIGTALLSLLEAQMRARAVASMHAEASLNAEGFYRRRGYVPTGPRRADVQPIVKRLA
jgi:putative acetyltransferase